jgi:Ca-activated chloride channel family protein
MDPLSDRHESGAPMPLVGSELQVEIVDLVAGYVLRHRFRNEGEEAIEAVFSFPVPLDAAFLGMHGTLAGETLEAKVEPARQAERTYDDAVSDGHSAVLLTAPESGLLCVNLGNLLPGEDGLIELRFASPLAVADGCTRFSLPLVHRPRYGRWRLQELETPDHDFAVRHPLSATIRVNGMLALAKVACASHGVTFARKGDALELSIGHAMLDRDLVLRFDLEQDLAPSCHLIEDGETSLGLASFVLPSNGHRAMPLDLCLLLDGSGSMAGDAIAQSRKAVMAVADALTGDDRIQVLRFGSTVVPMFRRPLRATPRVRDALRELARTVDSNLGGTKMGAAIGRALDCVGTKPSEKDEEARSRVVILVTDGAVQAHDIMEARMAAVEHGIRIFVVAVGGAAGAEVLQPLAEATGAVMERAVPAEPVYEGVMRQFRRAREAGAVSLQVGWPGERAEPIPMGVAYPGDAVSVAARLPVQVEGEVVIRAPSVHFALRLDPGARTALPLLRAVVGLRCYRSSPQATRESTALRYGLLTPETSAVLVRSRGTSEQGDGLPKIVRIPQMLPDDMIGAGMSLCAKRSTSSQLSAEYLDIPTFLRRSGDDFSKEDCASGYRRNGERIRMFAAGQAREVYRVLHRALVDALMSVPSVSMGLGVVIHRLREDLRGPAEGLLMQCGLALEGESHAIVLLRALNAALEEAPFSDEQEALLAVRSSRFYSITDAFAEMRLELFLSDLLHEDRT